MKILVLTVSDRASKGVYNDLSGPAVEKVLREEFPDAGISVRIVPDEIPKIRAVFEESADCDLILTAGGTGLSARDVTPEATEAFCDRLIPGIPEALRRESLAQTPQAMLSRAIAGQKGKTVIINLPGSVRGAEFCARVLLPVLRHAPRMIAGEGHA